MVGEHRQLVRVLIVDDHVVLSQSLAAAIAVEDDLLVVGTAASAASAAERVGELRPDVVLMDVELGDGSGIDVTAEVKRRHPTTAVVMLTSHHADSVLRDAIDAGCTGFVGKHEPIARVFDAIRSAAVGESVISTALLARLLPRFGETAPRARTVTELTSRELEVLQLLAEGISTGEIAERLYLSVKTVRNYIQGVLQKLDAHSRLEAVASAQRAGLLRRG